VRAHHAEETTLQRPVGNRSVGSKPANCQLLRKNAVSQKVCQFSKEVTTSNCELELQAATTARHLQVHLALAGYGDVSS